MDWVPLAQIGSIFGLFLWSRAESRSDFRRVERLIIAIKDEVSKEMRDFHGRFCTIEERNKVK